MRGLSAAALLLLPGCNPGVTAADNSLNEQRPASSPRQRPAQDPANDAVPAAPVNVAGGAPEPGATPGLAEMSPYRRREYERGYRDCMTGNFNGERQGESYRIGCMAAEDVKQRRAGR